MKEQAMRVGTTLERRGYTLLVVALLGPLLAHGLWLPLRHFLGPAGDATVLTWSALGIGMSQVGLQGMVGRVGLRVGGGALLAVVLALERCFPWRC